jgi:UDP-N-acetyl-D-glucosamine dehydrogenase
MSLEPLFTRLADEPTVAVIGLGYVGLPLALELARGGAHVLGVDVSEGIVDALNHGRSHVDDVADVVLQETLAGDPGSFRATTNYAVVHEADAIVVCVPTPLRKTKDPDISFIVAAIEALAPHCHAGQLVVLESTTYPGTTVELLVPALAERGLQAGTDVAVAFSPERVDPGNPRFRIRNTPKVVGGVTPACTRAARLLYERACDHIVEVSTPTTAEMVKLLENTFRMVNVGLANEFALICKEIGVDVWEVIEAASTKPFGFMPFWPGPGLGGHCIPVDPHYLAWKLRAHDFTARFVELADAVNSRMPGHVVSVVADALNAKKQALNGSRILVLGVAYKPDITDVRESPALDVIEALLAKGAEVSYHDPFVPSVRVGERELRSVAIDDAALKSASCVLITTHHSTVDYARVVESASLVVDSRNATRGALQRSPGARERVIRI